MAYPRVARFIVFFLALILFFQDLEAQSFVLPPHKKKETIPFKLIKNLIIIPVIINGEGPFNFVLDTGVGLVLITDYKLADSLKLQNLRNIKLSGLGKEAIWKPLLHLI